MRLPDVFLKSNSDRERMAFPFCGFTLTLRCVLTGNQDMHSMLKVFIMPFLLVCCIWLVTGDTFSRPAYAAGVPKLTGRINDYASMISPEARRVIETKLDSLEKAESTQIVILTVTSLEGVPIEDFSIKVAEEWKIGQKKYDNGVLLIVSRNDRKIRIEVGYGLEGRLTDLQSGRIINNDISPLFKAGRTDEGFINGVNAIIASVKGEYKAPAETRSDDDENGSVLPFLILIILLLYFFRQISRGSHGQGPMIFGGGPGYGGFGSGGSFGGGGSFGSDGGFSGGGGGFGGGGASGDW
jgi:uncharacterized protein